MSTQAPGQRTTGAVFAAKFPRTFFRFRNPAVWSARPAGRQRRTAGVTTATARTAAAIAPGRRSTAGWPEHARNVTQRIPIINLSQSMEMKPRTYAPYVERRKCTAGAMTATARTAAPSAERRRRIPGPTTATARTVAPDAGRLRHTRIRPIRPEPGAGSALSAVQSPRTAGPTTATAHTAAPFAGRRLRTTGRTVGTETITAPAATCRSHIIGAIPGVISSISVPFAEQRSRTAGATTATARTAAPPAERAGLIVSRTTRPERAVRNAPAAEQPWRTAGATTETVRTAVPFAGMLSRTAGQTTEATTSVPAAE